MADTRIQPIPKQGKFRRALAAFGALAPSLSVLQGFDYTLEDAPNAWSRSWHG